MDILITELEGITAIGLGPSFEELVTAQAVITEVKGPDHPLVDPSAPGINIAKAVRGDIPEATEQLVIEGPDARALVDSLTVVAFSDEGNFKNSARYMLTEAGLEAPEIKPNQKKITVPVQEVKLPKWKRIVKQRGALLTPDSVELCCQQHRSAALEAIHEFAAPDIRDTALEILRSDIDNIDPFTLDRSSSQVSSYEAPIAGEIVDCLVKASERGETVLDHISRVMIENAEQTSVSNGEMPLAA